MIARSAVRLPAATVYLIMNAAAALSSAMVFTVSGVYLVTVVGLNPLQLVLVGTSLEVAVLLFEVPTGVVADVYSRRLSIIIGMFGIGAGFVLWGATPVFAAVLLAQVIWGIGYTFTSGADTAWIADEVGESRVPHLYLLGAQARQVGSLCGSSCPNMVSRVFLTNSGPPGRGWRGPSRADWESFGLGPSSSRCSSSVV